MDDTTKLEQRRLYALAIKQRDDQQAYWTRTMATPPPAPEPEEPDAYSVPESARTRTQWGQDVPTVEGLRSLGQFTEPVVEPAPATPIDNSVVMGTHSAQPRHNPSPWRAFDFGSTFDN